MEKQILKYLKNKNHDLSDLGNEIGKIIGKIIVETESKLNLDLEDFISGVKYGVSESTKFRNLTLHYDDDDDTGTYVDAQNPFLKLFTNALDKLLEKNYSVCLEEYELKENLKKKNITDFEFDLISILNCDRNFGEFFEKHNIDNNELNRHYIEVLAYSDLIRNTSEYKGYIYLTGYTLI